MRFALVALALAGCGSSAAETTDGGDASSSDASSPSDGAASEASTPNDGGATSCKRGIAANATPTTAFTATAPGISWWYDWSNTLPQNDVVDFVPMIWGEKNIAGPIPSSATFLLGFNEPNFKAQSNLTPAQAAADWPQVEALAKPLGIPLVSPAVNFCGSAQNTTGCSDPTDTDPYTWLKDFFTACTNCRVDAIAVHWYNCDLPSLQAYIEGNNSLEGFVQFGKPIWLTEFSCDGSHSVADQTTYMQAAVPWLENNPHVARYAWFDASPIPNALLQNTDGTLTNLGKTYVALPRNCP